MWKQTLKNGLRTGLDTTWTLGKIIFPVTLIVAILSHTPVLPWLVDLAAPFMKIFGLSGEAGIPLVLGNFVNLYADRCHFDARIDGEGSFYHRNDVNSFS